MIHNINYQIPFPIDQDFYLSPTFQVNQFYGTLTLLYICNTAKNCNELPYIFREIQNWEYKNYKKNRTDRK